MAITLSTFNDIIDNLNTNLAAVPEGCGGPGTKLPKHDRAKPFIVKDITDIRDAINAVCPYDFQEDLKQPIRQAIFDDISAAVANMKRAVRRARTLRLI